MGIEFLSIYKPENITDSDGTRTYKVSTLSKNDIGFQELEELIVE